MSIEKLQNTKKPRKKKKKASSANAYFFVPLLIVFSVLIVVSLFASVFLINSTSMYPALKNRDLVVSLDHTNLETGDIIVFHFEDKYLVKRIIAQPGSLVSMDDDGIFYVDGTPLDEPYISIHSSGQSDVIFPIQVPPNQYFVAGDNRLVSIDSRNSIVGFVSEEQILGEIVFCIWPFSSFGHIE